MRGRSVRIATLETDTYRDMWAVNAYAAHSPGESRVPMFLQVAGDDRGTLLDAGAGSGRGAVALREAGFDVTMCDLTGDGLVDEASDLPFRQAVLWEDLTGLGRFRWGYCCDVMEHIPPPFTMLVARRLLDICDTVFFSISLVHDTFGSYVGKPLHQSVQSFTAWRDQLDAVGEVIEARDLLTNGVYVVRARC